MDWPRSVEGAMLAAHIQCAVDRHGLRHALSGHGDLKGNGGNQTEKDTRKAVQNSAQSLCEANTRQTM
eukprot:146930-Amphidinium_carterae.1